MPDQKLSQLAVSSPATTPLTGTELVYVVQGGQQKGTTTQAIANKAPATNLAYDLETRLLSSSTGTDVTLPEATTLAAGLLSAANQAKLDAITVDRATLTVAPVRNNTGSAIAKGVPVYVTGSSGTTKTIAPADASVEATAANTLGLTLEAIANNSDGYVVTEGPLTGVNTSGLTEGGLVFVSETTGQLTSTRPTQPAHGVVVGWCVKAGAGTSGILYVKVDNGLELDELHDVLISSATTGQVLRRASSGLWTNQTLAAADVGADASGTAAAAITAHLETVDHTSVTLGATVADVLGLTGQQLTADDPGASADRLLFWDHSAGRLRHLALGSGLTITDTTIDAAGGTGGYPAFSAPTGFSVTGSGTASIALSFATGYSLPTTASQASWDTAAGLAATAVQPAALSAYVQTSDSRLTDAREWSAATVTQAAAEAGTETERRAWTVQRVWQAAGAWWLSITGATGRSLAGAATPAAGRAVLELGTAATTDATAYASASHTQPGSTITGAYTAAGLTMATARFLARWSSGSGAAEEGSFGAGLSLSASGVLSVTAAGTKTIQRFTPRDNQPPAVNFATLNTRNSIAVLEFDAATQESAAFVGVISEAANLASGLMVRIWWMGATATGGNVRWGASFERTGTDTDADSFDSVTEVTSAANGTSGIETVAEITCTAIDSLAAGERFRLRVQRIAADATNDTMTGDAQLIAVEVRGVA